MCIRFFFRNCNALVQRIYFEYFLFSPFFVFKIEENTKVLASLGYRYGGTPVNSEKFERSDSARLSSESPTSVTKHGRVTPAERWKQGARKALLQWVQELVNK